jgi:hypothetical protein
MKARISMKEAAIVAQEILKGWGNKIRPTGLQKCCPRCARRGWVFLFESDAVTYALVVWDGKSHMAGPADFDWYEPGRLFRPTTGCGHDEK